MTALIAALFVAVMVAANLLIAALGPWATPFVAFVFVGLSMVSRDYLHDGWRHRGGFVVRMGGIIVLAGVLAWAINPAAGRVAVASAAALVVSAAAETLVFDRLYDRPWLVRSNGSNLPGALVDSVVFIGVAFGLSWAVVGVMAAQTAAKLAGGVVWSLVARSTINPDRRRAQRRLATAN